MTNQPLSVVDDPYQYKKILVANPKRKMNERKGRTILVSSAYPQNVYSSNRLYEALELLYKEVFCQGNKIPVNHF